MFFFIIISFILGEMLFNVGPIRPIKGTSKTEKDYGRPCDHYPHSVPDTYMDIDGVEGPA